MQRNSASADESGFEQARNKAWAKTPDSQKGG
jgi:hypothetical protein